MIPSTARPILLKTAFDEYKIVPRRDANRHGKHLTVNAFQATTLFQRCLRDPHNATRRDLLAFGLKLLGRPPNQPQLLSAHLQQQLHQAFKRAFNERMGSYVLLKKPRYVHPPVMVEEVEEDAWVFEEEKPKDWVEIVLKTSSGKSVSGARFKIVLPDGSSKTGTLGPYGVAYVSGIPSGDCKVFFPDFDKTSWRPA